jgi:predicted DNA-binding transcriptional regulator AlpA
MHMPRGDDEELLSVEDAQQRLGISRALLWRLIRQYDPVRYHVPGQGKRVFFRASDVDRLVEPVPINEPQPSKLAA